MKGTREKKPFQNADQFSKSLDLPMNAMFDIFELSALGNREISLDGCKDILFFSENKIILSCNKMNVEIFGDSLIIDSFFGEQILLRGVFCGISFSQKEGARE